MACLLVLGCGFGLFSSPNTNAVMAVATLLLAQLVGPVAITAERREPLVAAIRVAAAVFCALCVLGTFASLARGQAHRSA